MEIIIVAELKSRQLSESKKPDIFDDGVVRSADRSWLEG